MESRAAHSHPKNTQVPPSPPLPPVVVAASIHYHSTETNITHMDDSLFSIVPPLFEKVVKWGSGSFEFYLPVRVISSWIPFDPGPFKGCYSVTSAERTFLMDWCAKRLDRGETLKHPFQTDAAASSWLNQSRDDRKSKTRPRDKSEWTIEVKLTWVTGRTTRRAWRHTFTKSDRR